MANMKRITEKLGTNVCRRCINKKFKVNLEPKDCRCWMYPGECSVCGEVHNIVTERSPSGKMKMLFK